MILHRGRAAANDGVERLRDLMKLPSLEEIFRELVLEEDTEKVAKDIVEVMKRLNLKGAVPTLVRIRKLFRDDETHFVQLAEHFFRRFFENEFVSQGSEARLTVIHALALLAVPPIFYTIYLILTYDGIWWNVSAAIPHHFSD